MLSPIVVRSSLVWVTAAAFAAAACGSDYARPTLIPHSPLALAPHSFVAGRITNVTGDVVDVSSSVRSVAISMTTATQICRLSCSARAVDLRPGDFIEASVYQDGHRWIAAWVVANGVSGYATVLRLDGPDMIVLESRTLRQLRLKVSAGSASCEQGSCPQFAPAQEVFFTGTYDPSLSPDIIWVIQIQMLLASPPPGDA